ncbi:MAG: hypothetical protein EXQ95_11465 [Alphaproteobacteria bacterium]|nr:hypothetical protein [Alphaproteobacteria bacterium]
MVLTRQFFVTFQNTGRWVDTMPMTFFRQASGDAACPRFTAGCCSIRRRRILDPDPKVHVPAAEAFWEYSTRIASFRTPAKAPDASLEQKLHGARMFFHYVGAKFFVKPGQLLAGIGKIRHLPCIIVQGRYDVVTRPLNAFEVKEAWPEADLRWVIEAGHDAGEPVLMAALTQAFEDMKTRVGR